MYRLLYVSGASHSNPKRAWSRATGLGGRLLNKAGELFKNLQPMIRSTPSGQFLIYCL